MNPTDKAGRSAIIFAKSAGLTRKIDEHLTFSPQVVGSIPTRPTKLSSLWNSVLALRQDFRVSANGLLMAALSSRAAESRCFQVATITFVHSVTRSV